MMARLLLGAGILGLIGYGLKWAWRDIQYDEDEDAEALLKRIRKNGGL